MSVKYTHTEMGEQVDIGMAGYYIPQKEVRLKYNGKEVLYVIGQAVIESSCCGTGTWIYSIVPGYILNWQSSKNENGLPITEVEPILDDNVKEDVRKIIEKTESASPVGFW